MGTRSNRLQMVLLAVATVVGSMLIVALIVSNVYPDDWRPVEATVQASHIQRTRPGTPQWSLMVVSTYDVSSRRYETTKDVFRNPDLSVTEAEASQWPPGRTLTLYFNANNPESVSLDPDGGREATTVAAVILTPLVVFIVGFIVLLVRRRRATDMSADVPKSSSPAD